MRIAFQILWRLMAGWMTWTLVFYHSHDVLTRLGVPSGYNVRHGNTGAVGLFLTGLVVFALAHVVYAAIGYHAGVERTESGTSRTSPFLVADLASLVLLPVVTAVVLYIIDKP